MCGCWLRSGLKRFAVPHHWRELASGDLPIGANDDEEEITPGSPQSSEVGSPHSASDRGAEMGKGEGNPSNRFVIAALSASSGDLEALENFFKHTPPDTGIGFIVVQHLAPITKVHFRSCSPGTQKCQWSRHAITPRLKSRLHHSSECNLDHRGGQATREGARSAAWSAHAH